jgi:hypothetical protein
MRWVPEPAVAGVAALLGLGLVLIPARAGQASAPAVQLASLAIGEKSDFATMPEEIEPKSQLKRDIEGFPTTDTTHKGDPYLGLRPSLEGRLTQR